MLLTIRTTHVPATDLGFLLHKHPDRLQTFELSFGAVHVFYPEATETACTAALLLDVDPVGLVRGGGATIDQYVNDRPYVASSFLAWPSRGCSARRWAGGASGCRSWRRRRCRWRRGSPRSPAAAARGSCGASSSRSATRWTPSPIRSIPPFRSGARAATSR